MTRSFRPNSSATPAIRNNPHVHVYVAPHGGHCAFLAPTDGYWAETTAMDFLTAAMPATDRAR